MITLQAFFGLYLEGFLENDPALRQSLEQLSREITEACSGGVNERIQRAHQCFVNAINSSESLFVADVTILHCSCKSKLIHILETRGVLLGIFGGGVPPASPNPDPISDQKMPFPTPVFRPGLKNPYPFSDLTLHVIKHSICISAERKST